MVALYVLSSFSLPQVISIGLLGFYFYAAVHMKHLADHMSVVSRSAFIFQLSIVQHLYFNVQVPLISLSVFVFAFSLGFGPIPWLMMSELFAPEVEYEYKYKYKYLSTQDPR